MGLHWFTTSQMEAACSFSDLLEGTSVVYLKYNGKWKASAVCYPIHLHHPLIGLEAMSHTRGRTSKARGIYHSGIYKHIYVSANTHRYSRCSRPASIRSPWTILRHYSLSPCLSVA